MYSDLRNQETLLAWNLDRTESWGAWMSSSSSFSSPASRVVPGSTWYKSLLIKSIVTPKSCSVKTSYLKFLSKLVGLYWMNRSLWNGYVMNFKSNGMSGRVLQYFTRQIMSDLKVEKKNYFGEINLALNFDLPSILRSLWSFVSSIASVLHCRCHSLYFFAS